MIPYGLATRCSSMITMHTTLRLQKGDKEQALLEEDIEHIKAADWNPTIRFAKTPLDLWTTCSNGNTSDSYYKQFPRTWSGDVVRTVDYYQVIRERYVT